VSLRAKLTLAFVLVLLVALIPTVLILNLGVSRYMGPPPGMGPGMGQGQGPGSSRGRMTEQVEREAYLSRVKIWSVWSGLGAFVLAGGAAWFLAGRMTRTLSHLRAAAHDLDLRDLSRRVPVEGQDEIADLAATFNRMCDRLEVEERSRRQLLADVAHELRHPLAVMKGRMELMQDGKVPVDQEGLLPLQDEVIRMTRLVGDLRDLSLAEVGGLSLRRSAVDLGPMLEVMLTNLEPVAEAKGIRLAATAEPGLPTLLADADRIRQVLLNLITNALQYTPEGGQVTVTATRKDSSNVQVSITDTGPGIDEADLPHIFDRFYRADKSRSRSSGGSGLGLAIVRSLVELHKGSIIVRSKPGEGACFTVTLPVGGIELEQSGGDRIGPAQV